MGQAIRVLSLNCWWGRAEPEWVVDLVRRERVDLFAAQELGFEIAEAVADELPFGELVPDAGFAGMGIAARAPIACARIPLGYREAHRAVLDPKDWPGLPRPLDVVGVHIQAPHAPRPFPSIAVRHRQMSRLERFFATEPSEARVVVGDYNATPAWGVYRRMRRLFDDAAILCARREGTRVEPTWGPTAGSRRLLRIDHAMVRGVEVTGFRVVRVPGSDHSGLLFDCRPDVRLL